MEYDSTADTLLHIKRVNELLGKAACILIMRGSVHDNSKLDSPEKELFDEYTPKLKDAEYGSDEYKEFLVGLKPALDHHYANNSHHPEHTFSDEIWKDIKGYVGIYQISNKGRVKRVKSIVKRKKQGNFTKKEQLLKPHVTPKGYARLQLSKEGKNKNYFVHTLVSKAFLKSIKGKEKVNHKDGNKLNNFETNLEYVTDSENLIHAYDMGLRTSNAKYVVYCKELDITTIGTEKMEKALRAKGYERASSSAIWRCINSDNINHSHLDLHFESQNINEYPLLDSPINGMDLFDLIELFFDWWAATERTKNGDIYKSIFINEERFKISPQIANIFKNTAEGLGYEKPEE